MSEYKVILFKYFGSILHEQGEVDEDVSHMIVAGQMNWFGALEVLCSYEIPAKLHQECCASRVILLICDFIFLYSLTLLMDAIVLCAGVGNFSAIFLLPILMYYFKLGVTGAAISTVVSQYVFAQINLFLTFDLSFQTMIKLDILCNRYTVTCLMIWYLNKRAVLLPPKLGSLQFGGYLKSGKC